MFSKRIMLKLSSTVSIIVMLSSGAGEVKSCGDGFAVRLMCVLFFDRRVRIL